MWQKNSRWWWEFVGFYIPWALACEFGFLKRLKKNERRLKQIFKWIRTGSNFNETTSILTKHSQISMIHSQNIPGGQKYCIIFDPYYNGIRFKYCTIFLATRYFILWGLSFFGLQNYAWEHWILKFRIHWNCFL